MKIKTRWISFITFAGNKTAAPLLGLLLLLVTVSIVGGQDKELNGGSATTTPPSPPKELPAPPAFTFGEKLMYTVHYLGMNAGTAQMSVLDKMIFNGHEVYPILATAQSNDFISLLYPVNTRIESYMDVNGLYSHLINVKQHEGKKKRDKRIEFDQEGHKATQSDDAGQSVFDVPPKVNDSLSSLYYFRTQKNIAVGQSVFIDVHESKKNWKLEIRVLGKERVTTPLGTFDTLKVQAMPRYEGIFQNKGDLFIWVTDDDRKIPVIMKSKIKVGSITVTLISQQEGQLPPRFVAPPSQQESPPRNKNSS